MVCGMIHRSEMQVLSVKFWSCSPISVHAQVLDLDDLAAARAQTSAQTAAEHINLRSVHLLCRPLQARTAAITHLPHLPRSCAWQCLVTNCMTLGPTSLHGAHTLNKS